MVAILEKHGISWSLWSNKDARSMGTVHPAAGEKMADQFIARFPTEVPNGVRRKIHHRILANYQFILVERYRETVAGFPFSELMTFPDSFRFENCEIRPALVFMMQSYTTHRA